MIYTLTLNPSLDYITYTTNLKIGFVNRAEKTVLVPGGKGINVSLVLKQLGCDSMALGFTAGFTGREIEAKIAGAGIATDFVHSDKGLSRINVKISSDESAGEGNVNTEINAAGPDILKEDVNRLMDKLHAIKEGDYLVLAGNALPSLSKEIYGDIMKAVEGRKVKIVVDATGDLLLNTLRYKPFLVKPNEHELGELFSVKIESVQDAVKYGAKLKKMGAGNVLVSMGDKGAVLISEEYDGNPDKGIYYSDSQKGRVISTVGSGDSMIAGFVYGCTLASGKMTSADYEKALKTGVACGSATAFSDGLATYGEIMALM